MTGPRMFDDAVALIRTVPGSPMQDRVSAREWLNSTRAIVGEYEDPTQLVLGLTVVARQLAKFIADTGDATYDQVLDVVYSKVVEAGVAHERSERDGGEA